MSDSGESERMRKFIESIPRLQLEKSNSERRLATAKANSVESSSLPRLLTSRAMGNKSILGDLANKVEIYAAKTKITTVAGTQHELGEKISVGAKFMPMVTRHATMDNGRYIILGTADHGLYLLDMRQLMKLDNVFSIVGCENEPESVSEILGIKPIEVFKNPEIVSKGMGAVLDMSNVLGENSDVKKYGYMNSKRGVNIMEINQNENKILTCGSSAQEMRILDINKGVKLDRTSENDRKLQELWDKTCKITAAGLITPNSVGTTPSAIVDGVWLQENTVVTAHHDGRLRVWRLKEDRFQQTPTEIVRIPKHDMPIYEWHKLPKYQMTSHLVGVNKIETREELVTTSACGEIYILLSPSTGLVKTEKARRQAIPRDLLLNTSFESCTRILTCQDVDKTSSRIVVGSLFGLSFLDSREPHHVKHVKIYDTGTARKYRKREEERGFPRSLAIENNLVYLGTNQGQIIFFDTRNEKFLTQEDGKGRVTWELGPKGSRFFDGYEFPLLTITKKDGVVVASGGPTNEPSQPPAAFQEDLLLCGQVSIWR